RSEASPAAGWKPPDRSTQDRRTRTRPRTRATTATEVRPVAARDPAETEIRVVPAASPEAETAAAETAAAETADPPPRATPTTPLAEARTTTPNLPMAEIRRPIRRPGTSIRETTMAQSTTPRAPATDRTEEMQTTTRRIRPTDRTADRVLRPDLTAAVMAAMPTTNRQG